MRHLDMEDLRLVRPDRSVFSKAWRRCVRDWPVWLFLMCGGIAVGILSSSMKPALPSAFFMVQLSDPQFGLQYNNLRWDAEEAMLNESIAHINRLSPLFVVLTGDMCVAGSRPRDLCVHTRLESPPRYRKIATRPCRQNCKSDMQNCDAGQAELQVVKRLALSPRSYLYMRIYICAHMHTHAHVHACTHAHAYNMGCRWPLSSVRSLSLTTRSLCAP